MTEYLAERFAPGPMFGWLCLAFLAVIPLIWIRARGSRHRAAVRFSTAHGLAEIGATWASRTRFIPPLLRTLAILALVVALAKPQSGGDARSQGEGIAIQMVLDVSGSMAEEDFLLDGQPVRRLDAVKRVFRDFVLGRGSLRGREGDLIGMTTFAMFADTPCPLTPDTAGIVDLLAQTDIPGWVDGRQVRSDEQAGYTALGDAIVLATDDLRRAGEQALVGVPGAEPAKSRVMILLTDGADNPAPFPDSEPPKPTEAAKIAATLGIRIYTIGAAGSPRRAAGLGAFLRPAAKVDEPTLMEIASVTGGKYFRATDVESLKTIYEEIDQLERRRTGERTFRDNLFAAKVAMLTGLGLLFMELCLANTRYRKVP